MGRYATGERKYQIQEMWSLHHEIKRMLLLGMKHVDIAAELGISPVTVSYTANSTIVKRELDLMQGARDMDAVDIGKRIQGLLPKAVDRLEKILDSNVEAVALRACQDVLDRGGHGAVQKVAVAHAQLTKEDLEEIKKRVREAGMIGVVEAQTA